jgi:hypothetical protein
MVLKLFRGVWFLSVLAVLSNLLYVYASLPEQVVIREEEIGQTLVARESFFYIMTGILVLVNVSVYSIGRIYARKEDFRAWFHGLIVTINIFFIIAMSIILTYNSAERFDFSRILFIVYGSIGLVIVWAISWPVYVIIRKIIAKPIVSQ